MFFYSRYMFKFNGWRVIRLILLDSVMLMQGGCNWTLTASLVDVTSVCILQVENSVYFTFKWLPYFIHACHKTYTYVTKDTKRGIHVCIWWVCHRKRTISRQILYRKLTSVGAEMFVYTWAACLVPAKSAGKCTCCKITSSSDSHRPIQMKLGRMFEKVVSFKIVYRDWLGEL